MELSLTRTHPTRSIQRQAAASILPSPICFTKTRWHQRDNHLSITHAILHRRYPFQSRSFSTLGRYWIGILPARSPARQLMGCLLYTSDAADERSSVDLGGRRI